MALTKIQTAGITDDAVTAAAIADGTVVAAEIGADAVGASELADDAVASANIIDGAIVNADINASAAISGSKISGGTITSFASTGIDDYADALAITILSTEITGFGTTTPLGTRAHVFGSGTQHVASGSDGTRELIVEGANIPLTNSMGNIAVVSNTAQAADTGGQIAFMGKATDSNNSVSTHAVIKGAKENATSANIASYLAMSTRANGAGNTEKLRITSDGKVGIGITSPEAKLHVQTATAGSVTPHGNADELVIENSGSAGMSFLSPAGNEQFIMFGDVDDNDIGSISYNHYYNYLALKANAIETMQIKAGNIVMTGLGGIGNFLASMGDDAVTSITPNCNRGIIFVGSNSTHFGAGAFRCESGSQEAYILLNSSGTMNFTTGVQTGTSGTDGRLNVSPASDGKIYFNNRLGGGAAVWYTIVGAMW